LWVGLEELVGLEEEPLAVLMPVVGVAVVGVSPVVAVLEVVAAELLAVLGVVVEPLVVWFEIQQLHLQYLQ
jgi:hypothetical protein